MIGIVIGAIYGATCGGVHGTQHAGENQAYVDSAINAGIDEKTYREMEKAEEERRKTYDNHDVVRTY